MHQRMGLLEKQDWPFIHLAYAGECLICYFYYCYYCYYCYFESPGRGPAVAMTSYDYSHMQEQMMNARWVGVRHTALQHRPITHEALSAIMP